jgi:hypothetical protein
MYIDILRRETPQLSQNFLKYFDSPRKWFEEHGIKFSIYMGEASSGLEAGLPELQGKRDVYDTLVMDLYNRGVLNHDKATIHVGMSEASILESRTTELGKRFLGYIEV